jgi:hypothetical protein
MKGRVANAARRGLGRERNRDGPIEDRRSIYPVVVKTGISVVVSKLPGTTKVDPAITGKLGPGV